MIKYLLLGLVFLSFSMVSFSQSTDASGFFMWDESTDASVVEAAIAEGLTSFRSRDITIVTTVPAWNVFTKYPSKVDLMVAIPINYSWTTTPVDLTAIAKTINNNPFIRRLQIYPQLQPGLMNPSELNPCNDWLTGYADQFEARIRLIDQLVTDKSVEILVAGQMGSPGCADLTQIINTLYDLQSKGRKVAWGVTVYPYYYNQDTSLSTLKGDINGVLTNLAAYTPVGKKVLPLRAIETGWPSACSATATQQNECAYANSVFSYAKTDVKLYFFELQDFANGWSECEKHFGLWDASGVKKCGKLIATEVPNELTHSSALKIMPNPASDLITIQLGEPFSQISIYDWSGKQMINIINGNTSQYSLNTGFLAKGMYTLQVVTQSSIYTEKFMIQ